MMEPSSEIKETLLQLEEAMSSNNVPALARLLSRDQGLLCIGTDPAEWWQGYETNLKVWAKQLEEMAGVQISPGNPQGYREGTVGWAVDRPTIVIPGQPPMQFRVTAVFHQEDGEWKIVQFHSSIGVANEEVVGRELTV